MNVLKPIALSFVIFITGCSNNSYTADNNVQLNNEENYGLVVISINTEGAPKGFRYLLSSVNNEIHLSIPERGLVDSMLPMLLSDFDDIKGKLTVLKLPEGKYKFTEWRHTTTGQYATFTSWSKIGFPLFFDVEKGSVNYIGQISRINTYNGDDLVDSKIDVTDKEQRDIPLFLEKYPNIKSFHINKKLAYKYDKT